LLSGVIKAFWWNKKTNFGDLLTPLLLKRFARIDCVWAPPDQAQLVMVGSLLDLIPNEFSGIIFGSGKLHEKTVRTFPNAHVMALRGPLTARGIKGNYVLADAALLADELVPLQDKTYNLGLIPHWTDTELEKNKTFLKFDPKIIRVNDDPLKVISEISRCKKVVSSSLHGVILADALHIPRRIEIAQRMLTHAHQEGGLFKWNDYHASLGEKLIIGETRVIDRHKVLEKQYKLFDKFEELKKILK